MKRERSLDHKITKYTLKNGRISWGYHFFAGRDATDRKRQQQFTKQGFRTKAEAEGALRTCMDEHGADLLVQKDPQTFGAFFEDWLIKHGGAHWSKKTMQCNRQHAAYALRKFGDVQLQKLTHQRIEQDLYNLVASGGRGGRPLSGKTVQEVAGLVNQALAKAAKWKKIRSNPMLDVKRPPAKRREVTVPETDQFERFLESIQNTRYYAFSVFCAASGCRRGEALALHWTDIDFNTGAVRFSKSLSEVDGELEVKLTKSNRTRNVRISVATLEVLKEHRAEIEREKEMFGRAYADNEGIKGHKPGLLVFPRPDGRYYMPDQVSGRIREFMQRAGITASLHGLRHLHASLLLSKAVPVTVIQSRLGHATAQITLNVYSHLMRNDDAAALETWDTETAGIVSRTKRKLRKA